MNFKLKYTDLLQANWLRKRWEAEGEREFQNDQEMLLKAIKDAYQRKKNNVISAKENYETTDREASNYYVAIQLIELLSIFILKRIIENNQPFEDMEENKYYGEIMDFLKGKNGHRN